MSQELGLPGFPALAEELILLRDIELARATGGWLHVLHVTTRRGMLLIRQAKRQGVWVTAEVTPHHLLLTDEWVAGRRRFAGEKGYLSPGPCPDTNAKVNPPLRPEADALALRAGLRDGTFDLVATDHAPHHERDIPGDLTQAAFGMVGLEVALPLLLRLVSARAFTLSELIDLLSCRPATLLGIPGGTLRPGSPADVVVFDPELTWVVRAEVLHSRSANSPLLNLPLQGRVLMTVVEGKVAYVDVEHADWGARFRGWTDISGSSIRSGP